MPCQISKSKNCTVVQLDLSKSTSLGSRS